MMNLNLPSPVESIIFGNQQFYLKRDDLLHPDFSGNKARKLHYFLQNDFPDINKIISYGSAQSNAMYSLSVLANMRGWEFEYFVDHIADYLKENPHGNYKGAIDNGMILSIFPQRHSELDSESLQDSRIIMKQKEILNQVQNDVITLFIEEGGRQKEAEYGIKLLAEEIIQWQKEQGIKELNIFLPSGTGTTALFLQKHLPSNTVFTTPCVGDTSYLKKQFLELEEDEGHHPTILSLEKKHHFAKLYKENYKIWLELQQQTGVEFDLLYDPLGWRVLLAHPEVYSKPTLYIHQGGVLGNESMLPRYERKYPSIIGK